MGRSRKYPRSPKEEISAIRRGEKFVFDNSISVLIRPSKGGMGSMDVFWNDKICNM